MFDVQRERILEMRTGHCTSQPFALPYFKMFFFIIFFFFDALYQEYLLKAAQRIKEEEEEFTDKPSRHVWQFRENPAADWLKKGE